MATHFRPKIIPQEQSIKKPFFVGIGALVVTALLMAVAWSQLPAQIPLFYSKPWGETQLAPNIFLALPLILSLFLLIVNSIGAQILSDYIFIKKILIFGAATTSLLAAITVIRIILLTI
jgi:hypothetical protein